MLQALGQHVGGSELPGLDGQSLTVSNDVISDRLQVGSQDLGVLGVDDLAKGVHRHRGFFSTELE